ncbi:methyltransferase domain-containing protein [Fusibacter bizertensis]|jgi:Methyltransferase domain.|uniref:Methyltransferase domain-containing protein n=1 Tax=Fusibacter bizertensis TaxID=1488331 RepID=A0ABT6NDS6_9FIRM|nr:methyltransferase domain-containing protein [Fusibacter bizertensis]MDH8678520.1 methyltransferase domain-containing protein [Fusibacter bizertensis]
MTVEQFRKLSPNHFTPVDIILEWQRDDIKLHCGESDKNKVTWCNNSLFQADESVDIIVLSEIENSQIDVSQILKESRRTLKKNGRIFVSVGSFSGLNPFGRLKSKYKINQFMELLEVLVSDLNLLIDKNYILEGDQVYLELVKLESDYIKKRIVI